MKNIYKISFAALVATPLLGLFSQNTYAAMPGTFKDENFYNCVVEMFDFEYPGEAIAESGLTNEQLGKVNKLYCIYRDIADVSGLELMTSLTVLDLWDNNLTSIDVSKNVNLVRFDATKNNLTSIDVSHNPNLTILRVDGDVVVDTGIIPQKDNNGLKYDLSSLKFLDTEAIAAVDEWLVPQGGFGIFDYCTPPDENGDYFEGPLCNSDNITYDRGNQVLYVNDFFALDDFPQIIELFAPQNISYSTTTNTRAAQTVYARAFAKLKLAEPESEPESEPDSNPDGPLSPDTGYFTENFGATDAVSGIILAVVSLCVTVILSLYFKHKRKNLRLE